MWPVWPAHVDKYKLKLASNDAPNNNRFIPDLGEYDSFRIPIYLILIRSSSPSDIMSDSVGADGKTSKLT